MRKNDLKFENEEFNHGSFYPYEFLKHCKLTGLIVASVVIVFIFSLIATTFGDYKFNIGFKHPLLSSVLLKEYKPGKEPQEPDSVLVQNEVVTTAAATTTQAPKKAGGTTSSAATTQAPNAYPLIEPKYETYEGHKARSAYYSNPGKIALTTDYPSYQKVSQSYYDDACFIGDSRIGGLHDYSSLTNATYYFKEGINVYDLMKDKIAKVGKKTMSIPDALASKQFKKIYIMVGINELGQGTTKDYAKAYKKCLDTIRQLQPNAIIYIMGVMHVTTSYSDGDDVFNNDNINDKNVAVSQFANGVDTFYLDMNPVVDDGKGGVKKKYTWDGIHLQAQYYSLWVDFLNEHGLPDSAFNWNGAAK